VLEAAGETKSTIVSLSKPITTDELAFRAGTLELDLRQIGGSDLEPSADDELLLGYGELEVESKNRFPFGDAKSPNVHAGFGQLPEHYRKSGARLELTRAARDHETRWLIRIALGDEPNGKTNGPVRLSLRSLREKMRACASNDLDGVDAAARALAADLNVQAPAVPGQDQRSREAIATYRNAIKKDVLSPAKEREIQLMQFDSLRDHALKMSAVIYRRVTPTMFARYLVMGDPKLPVADEPKADEDKARTDDDKTDESNDE
jgi:hypothetical protein